MDFTAERIRVPCYIGETRFKAGIFLSLQIVERKKYAEHLRLRKFDTYGQAKEAFIADYGKAIGDALRLNCLYEVRSREIYSVFLTPYYVGIVETELCGMVGFDSLVSNVYEMRWQDYLTYEEALKTAKEHFARVYCDSRLYICQNIPLNTPVSLSEVRKRNGVYQ